ncbi:MAG: stage II sporulation protein R, partial [Eubacteriales bacterium]|nr:stage II sporulation protein R [Eubacteriales bacterium]
MNTYINNLNLKKIKEYLKNEKTIILSSIIIVFILTVIITTTAKGYSVNIQNSIAEEVIRFHVLANSDSQKDQELKLKVKNGVINMLANELDNSKSKSETKELLIKNIPNIEAKALEIIKENGYNYPVSVSISNSYFPTKVYGDISLPAGEYEALKIEIGDAKGQNWWCVMFPPLCFVDVTVKEVPEKDKNLFKDILTEEEYELISKEENKDKFN